LDALDGKVLVLRLEVGQKHRAKCALVNELQNLEVFKRYVA
jgi:hypothetical protein